VQLEYSKEKGARIQVESEFEVSQREWQMARE